MRWRRCTGRIWLFDGWGATGVEARWRRGGGKRPPNPFLPPGLPIQLGAAFTRYLPPGLGFPTIARKRGEAAGAPIWGRGEKGGCLASHAPTAGLCTNSWSSSPHPTPFRRAPGCSTASTCKATPGHSSKTGWVERGTEQPVPGMNGRGDESLPCRTAQPCKPSRGFTEDPQM